MNTITHIPKIEFVTDPQRIESLKSGLQAGDSITGRVLQSMGSDQYLVSLRGVNLLAQSDIPMKNGDRFKAKIKGTHPQLQLKISNTSNESRQLGEQWGVKGDDNKVVHEMVSSRVQLTKENFERINSIVKKFHGHHNFKESYDDIVKAAVKLVQLDIPPSEQNFRGVLLAVKEQFNMTGVMGNLPFFLEENSESIPPELLRFMQNLPMKFDPQMLARNLPAAVTLLGLLHESGLKDLLTGKPLKKVNLKWLMLSLEKILPDPAGKASASLANIESLQFRNLPELRSDQGDTTYTQLPVYYQGEWERVDVFFRNHGGNQQKMDKDNSSIRINLDTRFLGKISTLADIQNGALTVNMFCDNEYAPDFIQPYLSELKENLSGIGYDVRGISVSKSIAHEDQGGFIFPASPHSDNLNLIA